MILKPSLDEARALAIDYRATPVWLELPEQTCDPLDLFCLLKALSRHCFMFESLEDPEFWGRYTFLGYDPKAGITVRDGELTMSGGVRLTVQTNDPGDYIAQMLGDYTSAKVTGLPPFTGGLVGYFAYDYLAYNEPSVRLPKQDSEGFKDVDLMLFDKIIAYDHLEHKILLIATIQNDALEENYRRAALELSALARLISEGVVTIQVDDSHLNDGKNASAEVSREASAKADRSFPAPKPLVLDGSFRALFSESEYCAMVEQAKQYIREGDIFQVVLSNRLSAPASGSLFETYRILRRTNPSPYQFYFSSDTIEMAGASPETLVKLTDGLVQTFPLAGTRPRGASKTEDLDLECDLLSDSKELAEHNMLVDLGRNDVGKVSQFGTVKVQRYLDVLRFSHVMHLGSTVSGQLKSDKTALDVLDAILPAGTLSGAPKLRACQIISELEDDRRGVYGGAIGYLAFNGNMDTCIAIRLAFLKDGWVHVRSGAGIVADSDSSSEYRECQKKMQAVIDALITSSSEQL